MPPQVEVDFVGNEADFVAAAKKVEAETQRLNKTLKDAGVTQASYNKVVASANAALRQQADAAKKASDAAKKAADEAKKTGSFSTKFTELSSAIGLAGQALQALKAGWDFAKEGAQLEFVKSKFDNLSDSIGTTSDALLGDLKTASHGMYSDMELIASATDFVALGLANTHDEAVRLTAVSAGLNMNMNQLVLTLTNMTTMRFDALGVRVDGFKDKVKELEEQGYSTSDAFKEAFLQQAEAQLKLVGNAADSAAGGFMRMIAALSNMINALKEGAGQAAWVQDFNRGVEYTANAITKSTVNARENKAAMQSDAAAWKELREELGYSGKALMPISEDFERLHKQLDIGRQRLEFYKRQLEEIPGAAEDVIRSLDGMAGSLEEVSAKNKNLIDDAITIQGQQDKYSETQQEILDTITELEAEKATMRKGDIKGMEEINGKIDEAKEKYAEGAAAFVKAQQTKLAMMAIEKIAMLDGLAGFSEAEAAKALKILETADIAEAAALREAIAFDQASTAIATGLMTAEQLDIVLSRMEDGYTIDVAMNLTGNAASFAGTGTPGGTSKPGGNSDVTPVANARGGMLGNGWSLVGDRPNGVLTPYSELITPDGMVIDAATTRQMYAMGLVDKNSVESHALGGMQKLIGSALKPKAKPWTGGSGRPAGAMVQPTETQAQSQDVAQNQQNQQNLIVQSNMQLESMFGELIVAVVRDGPRTTSKLLAREMAKL